MQAHVRPTSSTLSTSHDAMVLGQRVAVVGSGELLSRTVGLLHRLGAQCVLLEDPFHATYELSRSSAGTYGALVLVMPCLYPSELACIPAIRQATPPTRILLACAEQHLSSLSHALRMGASGLLTEMGVELLDSSASTQGSRPQTPGAMPETTAPDSPTSTPSSSAFAADSSATGPSVQVDAAPVPADPQFEEDDEFDHLAEERAPNHEEDVGDPILSAEELHALLHDDLPATPGPYNGGRA